MTPREHEARLREISAVSKSGRMFEDNNQPCAEWAAQEIDRLRAECARLSAEKFGWEMTCDKQKDEICAAQHATMKAEAECVRLAAERDAAMEAARNAELMFIKAAEAANARATEAERQRDYLRAAIRKAGFAVMECANGWSIHDVSKKAKGDEARELQTVTENVDLSVKSERRGQLLERWLAIKLYDEMGEKVFHHQLREDTQRELQGDKTIQTPLPGSNDPKIHPQAPQS